MLHTPRVENGAPAERVADAAHAQMEDFQDGEEQAEEGYDVHHQQEDGFLGRPGHEAVHRVRTWGAPAHVGGDHLKAVEDVLAEEECDLEGRTPQQLAYVDFHEAITKNPSPPIVLHFCA